MAAMIKNEDGMSQRIFESFGTALRIGKSALKYGAREVPVGPHAHNDVNGDGWLDVVGYDKEKNTFKVVECKFGSGERTIRDAFKQIAWYREILEKGVFAFLDAFTRKTPMRFGRMMEATWGGKWIHIEFYVALRDKALEGKIELVRSLKEKYPDTGIIRVKDDGKLKHHLNEIDDASNYELARARAVPFPITWSPESRSESRHVDQAVPTPEAA